MSKPDFWILSGVFPCHYCERVIKRVVLSERLERGDTFRCPYCGEANIPSVDNPMKLRPGWLSSKPIPLATRRLVLKRAGSRCSECGSTEDLHLHHVLPRACGGSNEPGNLKVLYRHCHMKLEGFLPVLELTRRWLTTKEAAQAVGVKPATIAKWCKHKTFRHSRKVDGRWLVSDEELRRKRGRLTPRRRVQQ